MKLPAQGDAALAAVVERLRGTLGANLVALVQYGSSVRGDFVPGVSDLDLLIVLAESTPAAHAAIADAIRGPLRIDPLILGRRGMERSVRAFALKFRSIQRNHRVLHGSDPLAELAVDEELLRFLTEQSLRNLHLRLVHAYVRFHGAPERYGEVITRITKVVAIELSNVVRLTGTAPPVAFAERLGVLRAVLGVDPAILAELFARRGERAPWTDVDGIHARLFALVDQAVRWMEERWPTPPA